ncbi:hypothetical protein C6P40_000616 [Pichia californica]|uniref:Uncharacterized protein n=1 Tax=Pichia californica TaxID=460514 RepID=A0A9P6WM80_9ASCO|nr:hypothetical protein C6P42_002122 [[Candida] californica]KAG0688702.1 hypothetical protein C6P40_000616 [[Candida] californica]
MNFNEQVNTSKSPSPNQESNTTPATTAICPLCQKVSWTGEADDKDEVESVMNNFVSKDWCNCKHIVSDDYVEYPPKAGTGEKVDE